MNILDKTVNYQTNFFHHIQRMDERTFDKIYCQQVGEEKTCHITVEGPNISWTLESKLSTNFVDDDDDDDVLFLQRGLTSTEK
jgi:hypothetical protein